MKVLYVILILLALFIVLTLIRAIFFKAKPVKREVFEEENVNSKRVEEHLCDAIRIKTISHENEEETDWAEFDRFHEFLKKSFPLIYENLSVEDVSKASLLYFWQGSDSSLDPIAFLAHQDVVPVSEGTEKDWVHPAFDGVNDGEFIWGRGALDMKNHLICLLESVETLLEEGYQPKRSVYLCLGHNEEIVSGSKNGARELAKTLESRGVRLDSVVDEGGAMLPAKVKGILDANLTGIGIAEKGYADYKITVRSKGGHSSQPPVHSGIGEIAKVTRDLEGHQFKAKMPHFVYALFTKIGKRVSYPARIVTCNLWLLKPIVTLVMKKFPPAASLIRTTTGVSMAEGSPAANVLPQKSSITVNFRMMPGTTLADVKEHIKNVVKKKDIEIELLKGKEASKVSPTDSRSFKILEELCMRTDNNYIVAPYLVMGGTDSYHYENICDCIYRFAPFEVDTKYLLLTHATNERIPVDCMEGALKFFKRYIKYMSKE